MPSRKQSYPALLVATCCLAVAAVGASVSLWFSPVGWHFPREQFALDTFYQVNSEPGRSYWANVEFYASADVSHSAPGDLLGVKITPSDPEDLTVRPGAVLRLSTVGIYATADVPIRSQWFSVPVGAQREISIASCADVTACDYRAGSQEGSVRIVAKAEGKHDAVNVLVERPAINVFSDELPAWAQSSITSLSDLDIIQGYEDGRFGPGDHLTQGQIITLLARTLWQTGLAERIGWCGDVSVHVPADHYAYEALCLFHQHGWVDEWSFDPNAPVSRGQTAAYLSYIFGPAFLQAVGTTQGAILQDGQVFSDVPTGHVYFYDVGVANAAGVMTGNPDGTFGVDRTLNRAEAATALYRVYRQLSAFGISEL